MSYQTPQEPLEPFFDSPEEPGIMTTAKFGIYSLMALVTGIIITFLGFPFGGLFGIASLVLAIMSLVKKETPKWPAWITLSLSIVGLIIFVIFAFLIIAGVVMIAANS